MKPNRIQLPPGLSMRKFLEEYGTEALCEQALQKARWPEGFVCAKCSGTHCRTFRRGGQPLFECVRCGHQASLRVGTALAHSKLPLRLWCLAVYRLTQTKTNLSALERHRHLGVAVATAWRIKHKIMQCMADREADRKLRGRVEMDGAYLGGERNGGKAGRGSENKVPFVIAVSTTDDGRPRYAVLTALEGFTKTALAQWVERHLAPETEVFSDGLGAFRAVIDQGHAHTVIVTAGRRASCQARAVVGSTPSLAMSSARSTAAITPSSSTRTPSATSPKPLGDSTDVSIWPPSCLS